MFTVFSSLIKCLTYTLYIVYLSVGSNFGIITLDWAVLKFSARYVTFFLTNCVFPIQTREITCIYLYELHRKVSKSTIDHICLIFSIKLKTTETLHPNRYVTSCFELWFKGRGLDMAWCSEVFFYEVTFYEDDINCDYFGKWYRPSFVCIFLKFWGYMYSFSTICTSLFWLECGTVSIVLEKNGFWFSFKTYMFANHVETK